MVSETLWMYFHERWRDIDRTWRTGPMAIEWLDLKPVLQAERDALRAEVRAVAKDHPGAYLIPV